MISTWSHCWEEHRSSLLMAFLCDEPAWENDGTEVSQEEEPSLFARLDLEGVQMHVKLWTDITVENGIDVLEVDPASLLVLGVWHWVWLVEATSGSCEH